jgi:hypothetical protein
MSIPTVLYGHIRQPTGSMPVQPGPSLPVERYADLPKAGSYSVADLPPMQGLTGGWTGIANLPVSPNYGPGTAFFDRSQFAAIVPAQRVHPLRWFGRFVGRPVTPPTVHLPSPTGLSGLFRGQ